MFNIINDLLVEFSETGDPALDQQVADVRRKQFSNPQSAQQQVDQLTKQRLGQVSARIKALMLRKQQMNAQIDKQIEQERAREQQSTTTAPQ